MKIFDCHTHIENKLDGYDLPEVEYRNIIFNSIQSYTENIDIVPKGDSVSLIVDVDNIDFVQKECDKGKVNALKIHSRLQKLRSTDYDKIINKLALFSDKIPVIIDAFYYGTELEYQPSLEQIIRIAKIYPQKKFIIAHSGGYKVLEYFFHLRTLPNIWYDLSLSLQYLEDTSHYLDIKKLIGYTDKRKIMYGSDYHWSSPKLQLTVLQKIFNELSISSKDQQLILFENAFNIFIKQ